MSEYENEKGHREAMLLMDLAGLFTRGKLTGEQGLAVLEAAEALLRESKEEHKDEGMLGALARLYEDASLPQPLLERVLIHVMEASFWRENTANRLNRTILYVKKEPGVDLSKPWREVLGQLFRLKSDARAGKKRQLKGMAKQWDDVDDEDES